MNNINRFNRINLSTLLGFIKNLLVSTVIFTFVASSFAKEKSVTQWKNLDSYSKPITEISYTPDNKMMATASQDDKIILYDKNFNTVDIYQEQKGNSGRINFIPGNKYFITSINQKEYSYISLVNIADKQTMNSSLRISGHVNKIAVSNNGKYIATGNSDGNINMYSIKNNKIILLDSFKAHSGNINDICFSPDNKFIASASEDKTVRISTTKDEHLISLGSLNHSDEVDALAFSKDGKYLFSGSKDKKINVWKIKANNFNYYQTLNEHSAAICSLSVSPNNKYFASAGVDKSVILWELSDKKIVKVQTLVGHVDTINSLVFSPDNKFLISGSSDKTVKVWKL